MTDEELIAVVKEEIEIYLASGALNVTPLIVLCDRLKAANREIRDLECTIGLLLRKIK